MTDQEFSQFARRLFIEYPSLYEWLHDKSPDPIATQESWRTRLRDYTLAECLSVLDDWQAGREHPFAAYERDQVPMIVRSVIDKRRDKKRKQQEQDERRNVYQNRRRENRQAFRDDSCNAILDDQPLGSMDSQMRAVVSEGVPIHKRYLAGEITYAEYVCQRDEIIAKHLGEPEPVGKEWVG